LNEGAEDEEEAVYGRADHRDFEHPMGSIFPMAVPYFHTALSAEGSSRMIMSFIMRKR
jgi:hypothetical protein